MKKQSKNKILPDFFKPLLWSYDFSKINAEEHERTIIINAINYGDLNHWRWLAKRYGKKEVARVLSQVPVTEIKPRALRLAFLLFPIKELNYASRGTNPGR